MDKQNGNNGNQETPEIKQVKSGLWDKIKKIAKRVGKESLILILMLWYCLMDDDTPMEAKMIIAGALLYLISPLDLVPDILPFGLADDIAVLAGAAKTISMHIKPEHRKRAKEWVDEFFGEGSDSDNLKK